MRLYQADRAAALDRAVSHTVAERTGEIGIRMAPGAQVGDIRRLCLRYWLRLTIAGVATGPGAAWLMTPGMAALLYAVGPVDPVTCAVVSIASAGVTWLATYLPACRASRVQPVIALRSRV
jgi:ABC-type antimicrobial peptide transport system permease subunit